MMRPEAYLAEDRADGRDRSVARGFRAT